VANELHDTSKCFLLTRQTKKMKQLFILTTAFTVLFMSACTKENVGIELQAHDQNRMMDSMHAMMDRMMAMPKTNDPEIDFSKMMIMHHQSAVDMAEMYLPKGKDEKIKTMAQNIINEQKKEVLKTC
jgi:uncharacterized protein (DUF305 family)